MNILADCDIPYVKYYFADAGSLTLKKGRLISRDDLKNIDMLLVRSVTQVNEALLKDTPVKFVGTVTTGIDHLDVAWLKKANIIWESAHGFNSTAVCEYVVAAIVALQKKNLLPSRFRAAIIGIGNIGQKVVDKLKIFNADVLQCDPVRADNEPSFQATSLDEINQVDLISLHTPLTFSGLYPTYRCINQSFIKRQNPRCVLLNTSRGSVIDFAAIKQHGKHLTLCLDVWGNEPHIDLDVLAMTSIATPHIAGYTVESRFQGVALIYQKALISGFIPSRLKHPPLMEPLSSRLVKPILNWQDWILEIFNPFEITELMKQSAKINPYFFDNLRKEFFTRHEFNYFKKSLAHLSEENRMILQKLLS